MDILGIIGAASNLIDDAINKIWPDPTSKASADAIIIKATTDAALATMAQQMSVMLEEAKSADPWTSRARPSFLYVMYIMILACIPYSIIWAIAPVTAASMTTGVQLWLAAIPEGLWTLMGIGYTGYVVGRSTDKAGGMMPLITGKKK